MSKIKKCLEYLISLGICSAVKISELLIFLNQYLNIVKMFKCILIKSLIQFFNIILLNENYDIFVLFSVERSTIYCFCGFLIGRCLLNSYFGKLLRKNYIHDLQNTNNRIKYWEEHGHENANSSKFIETNIKIREHIENNIENINQGLFNDYCLILSAALLVCLTCYWRE